MTDLQARLAKLSPAQRDLVAQKLRAQAPPIAAGAIPKARPEGDIPLSFAQQRLWFLDQFDGAGAAYHLPAALRLRGPLDIRALKASLEKIVRRHEILRTTFPIRNGRPVQAIAPCLPVSLGLADLSDLPEQAQAVSVERQLDQAIGQPFDLAAGPLFRVKLLRLAAEEHVIILVMHHIVTDGWSLGVLIEELSAGYDACSRGADPARPDLPIQYADFTCWQREWLSGERLHAQIEFWKAKLAGAPPRLELPTDRPLAPTLTYAGATIDFAIEPELTRKLKALAQESGATVFMVLLAGYAVLLSRYSGQDDLVIGSPVANRTRRELEPLIGFFVNSLPLRIDLSGRPTVRQYLRGIRNQVLEASAHQDLPFEQIVEALQPVRNPAHTPIFQVVLAFQNAPLGELALGGLALAPVEITSAVAKFQQTLSMEESEHGLTGSMEYNTDLFDRGTIERLIGHLRQVLRQMTDRPEARLSEISLLTAAERRQLLVEWNQTRTDYPSGKTIVELFEEQARFRPEQPAVVSGEQSWSYRELDRRARHLATLLREAGVGLETPVVLCLERSLELIVGLLAVLKAGGAYVSLEPHLPKQRLSRVLEEVRAPVLLAQRRWVDLLPPPASKLICLDELDWSSKPPLLVDHGNSGLGPDHLAYISYTSGSTGKPKGVAVPHRGVARLVKQADYVRFAPGELFLQFAPVSFDASTFEIWGCLLNGGTLVLAPPGNLSLEELGRIIEENRITTLWLSAGLFHLMVDQQMDRLKKVRQLLAGGDVLSIPHVRKFLEQAEGCALINGYGPTENTTFTCCFRMTAMPPHASSIPIGRPISNTRVYILDPALHPVPIGVPGDLYSAGDGLARGYFERPDLTAEAFIPDPFSPIGGARLYRTGDRARYRPDGLIEFLGRKDRQVKLRGFRIEPGEIEAVLCQHPNIDQATVIVDEDKAGDKRLAAYFVASGPEPSPLPKELRQWCLERLPDYMVPATLVGIDAIPLNANGKLDRARLPSFDSARRELSSEAAAPSTPAEETVAAIWKEILGLNEIAVHENFFELGGHSLLATQVISRVREEFRLAVPLSALFEHPTVAGLAVRIEALKIAANNPDATEPPARTSGPREEIEL